MTTPAFVNVLRTFDAAAGTHEGTERFELEGRDEEGLRGWFDVGSSVFKRFVCSSP